MKTTIAVFIAAILLWSCQKEVSGEPGNQPTGAQKLILKHIHQIDEEVWVDTFSYDQQNRCTAISSFYLDTTAPGIIGQPWFRRFHYNGNEALPYKITDTSEGRDMNWYVFYDGQKRVIKDSVVFLRSGDLRITRYAYSGNRLVANSVQTAAAGTHAWTDTLESNGANYIRRATNDPLNNFYYQVISSYDNHPGAFSNLNIAPILLEGVTQLGNCYELGKNNPLTVEYSMPVTSPNKYLYTLIYVYDADGYPLSSHWTYTFGTEVETEKFIYNK